MYTLLKCLAQPSVLLFLLLGVAIAAQWFRRQQSRQRLVPLTLLYVVLALYSIPAIGYLLLGSLEWQYPPLEERPADADAILVLGCGETAALHRCIRAAHLYRQGGPCPVLVSGGKPTAEEPAEAEVMRGFLIQLGVASADVLIEPDAQTTYESAVLCPALLRPRRIQKIVLVTDARHLFRATRCFQAQGFDVIPAGCAYTALPRYGLARILPSRGGGLWSDEALSEWLGVAWYWVRGRI